MTDCWIITEGMIGTQNQCVALAQAIGAKTDIKTVSLKQPWKFFTPWIRHFTPAALKAGSSPLTAPWPDVIIASGRKAIVPALWVKKQSGNRSKLIIIQSPVVKDKKFDLVIAPHHDQYHADNAMHITGALSLITPDILQQARHDWQAQFEPLGAPRLAVLIGGNAKRHRLTQEIAQQLVVQLRELNKTHALMITVSRRTPEAIAQYLRRSLHSPNCFFWDGTGDNPYRGMLAWADAFLVTEDSVSMVSEAISTGKPTYIVKMDSKASSRFDRFYRHALDKNYIRWFTGTIDFWEFSPPDDLARAAARTIQLIT